VEKPFIMMARSSVPPVMADGSNRRSETVEL
jgi:hypothetical protein